MNYDLWAVDRGKVKPVKVIEKGWPFPGFRLTPGVTLLVRDCGPKRNVMRLDQAHLFRTSAEAEAAKAAGMTGDMPEPRPIYRKRRKEATHGA